MINRHKSSPEPSQKHAKHASKCKQVLLILSYFYHIRYSFIHYSATNNGEKCQNEFSVHIILITFSPHSPSLSLLYLRFLENLHSAMLCPVLWLTRLFQELHLRKVNTAVQRLHAYVMMDHYRGSRTLVLCMVTTNWNSSSNEYILICLVSFFHLSPQGLGKRSTWCFTQDALSMLFKIRCSTTSYKYCHHILCTSCSVFIPG